MRRAVFPARAVPLYTLRHGQVCMPQAAGAGIPLHPTLRATRRMRGSDPAQPSLRAAQAQAARPADALKIPSRSLSSTAQHEALTPPAIEGVPPPTPAEDEKDARQKPLVPHMVKAVAILTGSQFLANASFGLMIPVLPQFASEIGLGATGIGAILSAPAFARVLLNIPLGKAADKYGRKPLMLCGSLVGAAGAVMTAYAFSLATVLPARLLTGAGTAACITGASACMADITSKVPEKRAQLMGVQHTIVAAAYVAGPAIGGALAELYGVRPAFLVVGCALAVSSLSFSLLEETNPVKEPEAALLPKVTAMQLLRDSKETQGVAAMTGALFLGYTALHCVLPLHAAATLGASTGEIGMLFSLSACSGMCGAPLGGVVADRYGRGAAVIPAALLCAASAVCLASATTYPTFMCAIVGWGFGSSIMNPGLTALAADAAPSHLRGEALAIPRQAGDIAFLVGPLTLGILTDMFSCGFALLVTCFSYIIAALFFMFKMKGSRFAGF